MAASFVDRSGATAPDLDLWRAHLVSAEEIAAEVDRLAALPAPANGRRQSMVVHPRSTEPGLGLAPGIRVTLDVLLPGERTDPLRQNSAQVNFCIEGGGTSRIAGRSVRFGQHDVWTTPSMAVHEHHNDTDARQVRITYSNAALLEKLNIHYVEEDPTLDAPHPVVESAAPAEGTVRIAGELHLPHPDGDGQGIHLMSYEKLINPPVVEQEPLHWPWPAVRAELDKLEALGSSYRGRRLYLLYNPATGRTQGTTNSFFATMTLRPAGIVDRPHRHASAAINYFFSGSGNSIVGGRTYRWKAGDLMLTAPGWMIHRHASHDEPVYELTIQDSPLHIAMDSLLWQEDLRHPLRLLGSQHGFATNRGEAAR